MVRIDLMQLPESEWERHAYLLGPVIAEVMTTSSNWISQEYTEKEDLALCARFLRSDLLDAVPGDFSSLARVWYFPWIEAEDELSTALTQALMSNHRASYDSLRRAIELVVVGAYFLSTRATEVQAKAWYRSEAPTPYFSRALDQLVSGDFAKALDLKASWVRELKQFYHRLSDTTHVRGESFGAQVIQPTHGVISGIRMPSFSAKALTRTLEDYREAVRWVGLLLVVANPVIAVALPIDEKFGMNGPMSGFFQEDAVERLRGVLGERLWSGIEPVVAADPSVQSLKESIEGMPEITEEEIQEQVARHREFMESMQQPPKTG